MNTFARTLITFLFGWLRRLLQNLLAFFSEGTGSGLLTWLGEHWLHILILLIVLGVAGDFAVWMVRWRPYLIWRAWRQKFRRRLKGREERLFTQGYREGVAGIAQRRESGRKLADGNRQAETAVPWAEEPPAQNVHWAEESAPQTAEEMPPVWTQMAPNPAPAAQTRQESPLYLEELYEPKKPVSQQPRERKRRSERRRQGLSGAWLAVRERLNRAEEDEVMLDGLPPAVDRQDAFYAPVLPPDEHQGGNQA